MEPKCHALELLEHENTTSRVLAISSCKEYTLIPYAFASASHMFPTYSCTSAPAVPCFHVSTWYFANRFSGLVIALNSKELPLGSWKNIVHCSPGWPALPHQQLKTSSTECAPYKLSVSTHPA